MSEQTSPKEASNIFHSIIKASVSKTAIKQKKVKLKNPPKPDIDNKIGNG